MDWEIAVGALVGIVWMATIVLLGSQAVETFMDDRRELTVIFAVLTCGLIVFGMGVMVGQIR